MSEFPRPFPPDLRAQINLRSIGNYDVAEVSSAQEQGLLTKPVEVKTGINSNTRVAYWLGHIINNLRPVIVAVYPSGDELFTWYCGVAPEPAPQVREERDNHYLDAATSVVLNGYEAVSLIPDLLMQNQAPEISNDSHPDLMRVEDVIPSL